MADLEHYLVFLPEDQASGAGKQPDLVFTRITRIMNSWWVVHPEKGLALAKAYGGNSAKYCTPQCNANEAVAERLRAKIYPNLELRYHPLVVLRVRSSGPDEGAFLIPAEAVA